MAAPIAHSKFFRPSIGLSNTTVSLSPKGVAGCANIELHKLRAYRNRPASHRQGIDQVVLAHIKEQSRLSLGSYGRPRMTEELKELGLNVGQPHPRV